MPVIFMERSLLDSLTEADIKEIIDENEGHTKYAKLEGYYEGDHDILRHSKKDSTAPNNRLVNNMAKYITDTATGYFIGKPVVYSSQNDAYLEALQDIFDYNDEQDENMELAKGASINGDCFEMLYMDEDAQIRFTKVPPDGCIYICETGYNTPMAAIRIVYSKDKDKNIIKKVEFWTAQDCWYFRSINGGALELLDIREHYWGDVPFVEYINNEERLGDFEGVITLIDAYNRVESNTANFFQYNDEALLKVLKMGAVTSQDIAEMKEKGAIILEDGGDIQWLIKEVSDTALENYKKRLREDMHIFSAVPNLTDANFGGNLSGVAVSYTATEDDILKKLYYDIAAVQDVVGDETPLVITMSRPVAAIFDMSSTLSKSLSVMDFKQGDVTVKVKSLNGEHPILRVGSGRMKTSYQFYDGTTSGQEKGGFVAAEDAQDINWIICPRTAPIAVSRTDKVRIFDPETFQKKRAWATDYRKYHDLWIPDNKLTAMWVNIKQAKAGVGG